jgi:hypothetical protein
MDTPGYGQNDHIARFGPAARGGILTPVMIPLDDLLSRRLNRKSMKG